VIEEIRRAAIVAVSQVFEKMFFLFVEEQEEEAGKGAAQGGGRALLNVSPVRWVWGEIGFEGAASGKIQLTLPCRLALTLAANFMGLEEESVSEAELLDVVGELNNMISGNLFSLLNRKAKYTLTRPKTELISDDEKKNRFQESGQVIHFQADGHQIELDLKLFQPR
jgi:CheY-specific phosphatase CheX